MCGVAGSSGSGSFTRPLTECQLELQSSLGSTGAESNSRFTHWLLAGFSSLIIVVLRITVPSWLLARGCPQFFAPRAAHNMKLTSSKLEEPESTKEKSQFFILHLESDSVDYKQVTKPRPNLMGGNYTRAWSLGGRIHWKPSWGLTNVYHFVANRWRNNGNSGWLYFSGLQNHCRWWLQPWN